MTTIIKNFFNKWLFYFQARVSLFMCLLRLALTIYFFPHLFPDFVAHAITNDTLETPLSNNLPNIEETTTNPSRFPSPIQKEGALIAGYVLY